MVSFSFSYKYLSMVEVNGSANTMAYYASATITTVKKLYIANQKSCIQYTSQTRRAAWLHELFPNVIIPNVIIPNVKIPNVKILR